MSSILKDLQDALVSSADRVPKHMLTLQQIMDEQGWTRRVAEKRLDLLRRAKKWQMKNYRIFVKSLGYVRPVPHYGPVKPVA